MPEKYMKKTGGKLIDSANWGKTTMMLLIVGSIIAIIGIVLYIVYSLWVGRYKSKSALKDIKDLVKPNFVESVDLPATENATEYSYSVWVYISELTTSTNYKMIMFRGSLALAGSSATPLESNGVRTSMNPVIFMDKNTNKLFISVATSLAGNKTIAQLEQLVPSNSNYRASNYVTSQIDYMPFQRWVNLAVVIRQENMTVYLNGDVYSAKTISETVAVEGDARPMFAASVDRLQCGHSTAPAGFITSLQYWNYAVSHAEITRIYNKGPTPLSWWKKWLWFGRIKLQSPIVIEKDL